MGQQVDQLSKVYAVRNLFNLIDLTRIYVILPRAGRLWTELVTVAIV